MEKQECGNRGLRTIRHALLYPHDPSGPTDIDMGTGVPASGRLLLSQGLSALAMHKAHMG